MRSNKFWIVALCLVWGLFGWLARTDYDEVQSWTKPAPAPVYQPTPPPPPPAVVLWRPRTIPDVAAAVPVTWTSRPRPGLPARHANTGRALVYG